MRRGYPNIRSVIRTPLWHRFDSIKTRETHGDCNLLRDNLVSLTIPTPYTHRDIVERIARQSQKVIAIGSLAPVLSRTKFVRAKVLFGSAGDEIDKIATQYEEMRWWISKKGLNMAVVPPAMAKLSRFDEFAGELYVNGSKSSKLPNKLLMTIVKKLDVAEFTLAELQRAQRKPISEYNQKNPRQAIKTFEQACLHPRFIRSIRKRLYVARERYMRARFLASPLPKVS